MPAMPIYFPSIAGNEENALSTANLVVLVNLADLADKCGVKKEKKIGRT
jgi:hypothetical protein